MAMDKTGKGESQYEIMEEQLMQQSEVFIDMLTKRGMISDTDINDEKVRKAAKEKKRMLYHNTKMMLQNYRDITWALECFPSNVAAELDRPMGDLDILLDAINAEMGMENLKLENRMQSMQKSRLLMDRFNEALTVLKRKPKNGELMYKVLYLTYIVPEVLSNSEILYRLGICQRHYYRIRSQAINILSIRLWATPAAEMDSWIEILTLLETV